MFIPPESWQKLYTLELELTQRRALEPIKVVSDILTTARNLRVFRIGFGEVLDTLGALASGHFCSNSDD